MEGTKEIRTRDNVNSLTGAPVWVEEIQTYGIPIMKRRSMRLSTDFGSALPSIVSVYELEDPYTLVILGIIKPESVVNNDPLVEESLRMNITRSDISRELRLWINGKELLRPCCGISRSVEKSMMKYVKFGSIPAQESLILWILSRCEIYEDSTENDPGKLSCKFGGKSREGDKDIDEILGADFEAHLNPLQNTVESANSAPVVISSKSRSTSKGRWKGSNLIDASSSFSPEISMSVSAGDMDRRNSAYIATRDMLCKSTALSMMSKGEQQDCGAPKNTLKSHELTEDHYRLRALIETGRNHVVRQMTERYRTIETSKARQVQKLEHHREINEDKYGEKYFQKWVEIAYREVDVLKKIEEELEVDIKKQKVKTCRLQRRTMWQMNPLGTNLGGRSKPGPKIGDGPLPASAISNLTDPVPGNRLQSYCWDDNGRKHKKYFKSQEAIVLENTLRVIKQAANNTFVQSVDVNKVFQEVDSSGVGYISMQEMIRGMERLGVCLDHESARVLFEHFDVNGSGLVHFGEFVWTFFNSRGFMRRWKRSTRNLSDAQIYDIFQKFDKNHDEKLNLKEFRDVLKSFNMEIHESQIQILMDRLDTSGDGCIKIHDFFAFMNNQNLRFNSFETLHFMDDNKSTKSNSSKLYERRKHDKMSYLKIPLPSENYLQRRKPSPKSEPRQKKVFGHSKNIKSVQFGTKEICIDDLCGMFEVDNKPVEEFFDENHSLNTEYVSTSANTKLDFRRIQAHIRAQKDLQGKVGKDYFIQ